MVVRVVGKVFLLVASRIIINNNNKNIQNISGNKTNTHRPKNYP